MVTAPKTVRLAGAAAVAATALLTCSLLYFEDNLLTETIQFSPKQLNAGQEIFAYGDNDIGGTSSARVLPQRKLAWACLIAKTEFVPYCGYGFTVTKRRDKGINLSGFESVSIKLGRQAPGRFIRIYLKQFDPAYSRPSVPQTEKYNYVDVAVMNGSQTLTIPLSRFRVADWWKEQMKLPPQLSDPQFSNVVAIEVQDGLDGRPGRYVSTIDEVVFERSYINQKEFYGILALFWSALIGAILLHRRAQILRVRAEDARHLRWASEHDDLTGLPNRRLFKAMLNRAISQHSSIALLLLDLDHFKHINDTLGHAAGDELLKAIAQRLKDSVRAIDFVARIGGDEFAVIASEIRTDEEAVALGNEVINRLLPAVRVFGQLVSPGGSIGAAMSPAHAGTAEELFKAADTALYALKGVGRGGTKVFHPYMLEDAAAAAAQLSLAKAAIREHSIIAHYQPKVDLGTGALVGFEALLRCDGAMGLELPASLEQAFDDYELSAQIGEQMQRAVAGDVARWIAKGVEFNRVSINASPAEFLRDDYAERLLRVMAEENLEPRLIEIEVTERVFFGRCPKYVSRAVELLRSAGIEVSLDDFGTGYSSLSHLRDLKVDCVKIDQSFICNLESDPQILAIVSAITALTNSLGMYVVAEGIETAGQADILRVMGCGCGQGYLFGRPMPAFEVPALVSTKFKRIAA